ncbi:MAG TPA: HAD family hydrolase [Thermoplasmata archaeon]|nr:HAD family hydrolase [Thermoplasmata archaeon]
MTGRPRDRAVFFDLDDTLFDHSFARRAGIGALVRRLPGRVDRTVEEFDRTYQGLVEEYHPRVLAGEWTRLQARIRRIGALLEWAGLEVSPLEVARLARLYADTYRSQRRTTPGAKALLRRLAGHFRLGVITNNLVREQQDKLVVTGLASWIEVLVVSEEVGASKPDPAIFAAALERSGVDADHSVMVGDSLELDVLAARRCGWGAVWYRRNGARAVGPSGPPSLRSFLPTADAFATIVAAVGGDVARPSSG